MIKLYILLFLAFYFVTVFFRYIIGTSHDERIQTRFKLFQLDNKIIHFILFLSVSRKPIAICSVFSQISNLIFLPISLFFRLPIDTCFIVYFFILGFTILLLFIETTCFYIRFKGEWEDKENHFKANFIDGDYAFLQNGKKKSGYLDRYFNKKCVFFDEKNRICFSGKYKYISKEKVFLIMKNDGEVLSLTHLKKKGNS